jgi:type IV pilus assembly protein PilQ
MRRTSFRALALTGLVSLVAALGPQAARAAGVPGGRFATHIEVKPAAEAGRVRVHVEFTRPPTFTARLDPKLRRLIVDVPDAEIRGARTAITERVGVVGGVLAQAFVTPQGKTTRLLVTLLQESDYSLSVEGNRLVIVLAPGKPGSVLERREAPRAKPVPAQGTTRIQDVRFEHTTLEDKVLIDVGGTLPRYTTRSSGGRRALVLEEANLPEALSRTLDVSAFNGMVSSVSSYTDSRQRRQVVIEVDAGSGLLDRVSRRGPLLIWSFYRPGSLPSSLTGVAPDGGVARKERTVHVEEAIADLPQIHSGFQLEPAEGARETSAAEQAGGFTPAMLQQQRGAGRYTGRRIDLDLKDADVHNVLRLLADVGRVNIVTADDVSGTVTIRMRNVPWDQALDVILQAKGLGMVRQGNMIRVAPMAQLEKEREMAIARRRQEVQLAPLETRLIPVSYADAATIQQRARELLSERGTIAVDERTNVLIARDIAGNLNQIEELIRSLDTQTPQVLVEARIVEATSRYLRDVGIQWGGDATFSPATGNPTGLIFPDRVGVVGGASDAATPTAGLSPFSNSVPNPNFAVNLPAAVGTGQGGAIGLSFGSIDNTINLAVRLSAAEASGMLRILSSPRILTLDNREARIAQGTLIPFSQVSAQGVQTTFQEAKLQLLVKPHVTADGSISMHVKINRDEPDFNQTSARGDPTILKREAETDLLVMDGHTAVIGGIYTRNTGRNLDQVPFFGDIPILGLLFQRRRASDTRGELVIFLTPRIVNRAEALGR